MTTALIVDDEPKLINYLVVKLAKLWPELDVVGTAENGLEAVTLAQKLKPDIVFLDIKMPGLNGLAVAEMLPKHSKIVFVTAFDQYAADAFEQSAVDYLLKPVGEERLTKTIQRLKQKEPVAKADLVALVKTLTSPKVSFLQWLRVGLDDITELVPIQDVVYFKADLKYIDVVTQNKTYLLRQSLSDLESQLDPDVFWRINRGCIVRVDQIAKAKRDFRGRYDITLHDQDQTLRASQPFGYLFKKS
ncbi:MAG: LytTR family DNA-binding domain-containing protein [Planktomarina sp.]|nr:LytTR family DNA-binding domain-containing protein [Planktomarina sp.]